MLITQGKPALLLLVPIEHPLSLKAEVEVIKRSALNLNVFTL